MAPRNRDTETPEDFLLRTSYAPRQSGQSGDGGRHAYKQSSTSPQKLRRAAQGDREARTQATTSGSSDRAGRAAPPVRKGGGTSVERYGAVATGAGARRNAQDARTGGADHGVANRGSSLPDDSGEVGAFDQFEKPPKKKAKSHQARERERREEAAISLQDIFQKFSKTRATRKDKAYRELQQDLSDNASVLILSGQITMKEIVATITDLEEYLKGEDLPDGDDPTTYLSKWLQGDIPGDEFDAPQSVPPQSVSGPGSKVTPILATERDR